MRASSGASGVSYWFTRSIISLGTEASCSARVMSSIFLKVRKLGRGTPDSPVAICAPISLVSPTSNSCLAAMRAVIAASRLRNAPPAWLNR